MDFLEALQRKKASGIPPVIPDIKCISPKDGDLMAGRDPAAVAKALEAAGAPVLSVVTEGAHFGGSLDLLARIRAAVKLPLLRKDFVETIEDLRETKKAGADAILLMVSCLGKARLTALFSAAVALGLLPFVETHNEDELDFAQNELKAPLIGINNRDILILEKDDGDVRLTQSLLGGTRAGGAGKGRSSAFLVAESAMHTPEDVHMALRAGADAALVGTGILRAPSPADMYRRMTRRAGIKICGLMTGADLAACLESGVDICGFVAEYPLPVRWSLTGAEAAPLIEESRRAGAASCVVTGGSPASVLALAGRLRPDFVQLHFRETLAETEQIAEALLVQGIRVIRSIPMDADGRKRMFGSDDLREILLRLNASPVSAVLIDSRDAGNAASGGGEIFAQAVSERFAEALRVSEKTVILGGGITAENLQALVSAFRPDIVDIMTGAEDAEGRKSRERIRRITGAAERAKR